MRLPGKKPKGGRVLIALYLLLTIKTVTNLLDTLHGTAEWNLVIFGFWVYFTYRLKQHLLHAIRTGDASSLTAHIRDGTLFAKAPSSPPGNPAPKRPASPIMAARPASAIVPRRSGEKQFEEC